MRKALPLVVAVALGFGSALALAACGGDGTNPSLDKGNASELLSELDQIESNFAAQNCTVAALDAQDFVNSVQALPKSVDPDLRNALENGADQLKVLLNDPSNCEEPTQTTETTPSETTEATTTEETTTEETSTEEPTTTTTTSTGTVPGGGGGIEVP